MPLVKFTCAKLYLRNNFVVSQFEIRAVSKKFTSGSSVVDRIRVTPLQFSISDSKAKFKTLLLSEILINESSTLQY